MNMDYVVLGLGVVAFVLNFPFSFIEEENLGQKIKSRFSPSATKVGLYLFPEDEFPRGDSRKTLF